MAGLDLRNASPEQTMALDERPRVYDQHNLEGRDVSATEAFPSGFDDALTPLDKLHSSIQGLLQVSIHLGQTADKLSRAVAQQKRIWDQLQRGTVVDGGFGAAAPYPASGVLVLPLGSPDRGTQWEIMGCSIGGTDINVAAAGSAGLYVGGVVPQSGLSAAATTGASGGITNIADRTAALPNSTTYGTHQVMVNDNEWVFVVIFNGTSGQVYAANISASVYNIAANRGEDIQVL
jgi:hypothetical protein